MLFADEQKMIACEHFLFKSLLSLMVHQLCKNKADVLSHDSAEGTLWLWQPKNY